MHMVRVFFFCSINSMHLPITKYKHYAFSNHRYIRMSVEKKNPLKAI